MATDQEQPDEPLDAEMAWLLGASFSAPEPRGEFVRALSQRLDADFAALGRRPSLVEMLQSPPANGNGAAKRAAADGAAVNGAASHGQIAEQPAPPILPAKPAARRLWRRFSMFVAISASLFVAVIMFGPAYGWTAAIRHWVMAIVPAAGGRQSLNYDVQVSSPTAGQDDRPQVALVTVDDAQAGAQAALTPLMDADGQQVLPGSNSNTSSAALVVAEEIVTLKRDEPAKPGPAKKNDYEAPAAEHPKKVAPPWAPFDEALPVEELSQRVDDSLAAMWQAKGIHVAAPAGDVEFMRRVYLDLTGRIPSVSEVHEFLDNKSPERRQQLVDRLLAHHDHATHLAAVWRTILLPDGVDFSRLGGTAKFDEWLTERFAANKPYDQIVRDLLQAEGRVAESGPLLFYSALRLNPEELAGKTARTFLGVRMECAQCHNHPFDESVSQQDFWSFAAFFARISRPKGKMDVTSSVLQVRDAKQGDVMIPQSDKVVAPRLPLSEMEIDDGPDGPTRRQQLVDWLISKNNGQFARATVNRVWSHLFGRGLVEPVDDMRPANPALSPEVLETLARDFSASNFDLRRLLRALVLTKTYQLSSQAAESDPSSALNFAQMNVKSFTAEQLYDCITIATRQGSSAAAAMTPDGIGIDRLQDGNRQTFIEQFRAPPGQLTDYHAGIPQALTLMHGGLIHSATDLSSSGLLKSLSAPFFSDERRLETMFLSTLSRYPEPAEREVMLKQLGAATNAAERQQVLGDVLWALLNSGEFTFNH